MKKPIQILLQTTIPTAEDDWDIKRYSLLRKYLASLTGEAGQPLVQVAARDREADHDQNEPVLSVLDQSEFDELWLFAADVGSSLTDTDCAGIQRFRQRGGGVLLTRDHQDLGSCICRLSGIGTAHFFHSKSLDPDISRHERDDPHTTYIDFPNYHSGSNGDYQRITPIAPVHELLHNPAAPSGVIEFFPSHPHEGGVGVPVGANARVVATGTSKATGRTFNLVVAFDRAPDEHGNLLGRAVAESSFHHFLDYNWDIDKGCPSFVDEPPGNGMKQEPRALQDVQTYVRNLALWLAPNRA
jgi:hypothetical protein